MQGWYGWISTFWCLRKLPNVEHWILGLLKQIKATLLRLLYLVDGLGCSMCCSKKPSFSSSLAIHIIELVSKFVFGPFGVSNVQRGGHSFHRPSVEDLFLQPLPCWVLLFLLNVSQARSLASALALGWAQVMSRCALYIPQKFRAIPCVTLIGPIFSPFPFLIRGIWGLSCDRVTRDYKAVEGTLAPVLTWTQLT